jgi:general nucleoside transport system ATP-binding protein
VLNNIKDSSNQLILRLENISKQFPNILALNNVSIDVKKGEILAILGENGAGKSTLMKILSGLYQPDSGGSIYINEKWFQDQASNFLTKKPIKNPNFAMKLGIAMVYQHFQLIDKFSVTENIILGKEPLKGKTPLLDIAKANKDIKALSEKYGLPINPNAKIQDLPIGLKQRVEILKQLYRDARLLILDEPTAVLTPTEVQDLFKTMRELKMAGKSIIFISHKLNEPLTVADRIVTIRNGEIIGTVLPKDTNRDQLAEMIIGRKIVKQIRKSQIIDGEPILSLRNVTLIEDDIIKLDKINFDVHKYQILGIAGVQGNGQNELLETIMGIKNTDSGEIVFYNNSDEYNIKEISTLKRLNLGIGYIPEDRQSQGLILDFEIQENIWLAFYNSVDLAEKYSQIEHKNNNKVVDKIKEKILLPFELIKLLSKKVIKEVDVRGGNEKSKISDLSGGNQQKVLVGREFAKAPRLIIANQPTRGVDVGVMENIHQKLLNQRDEGCGILFVSSDLDEILLLSDKLIIMYEGRIVGYDLQTNFTMNQISQLMATGNVEEVIL